MKLKKKSVFKNLLYVVGFSSMLALTSCNNSDYEVNQYNDNAIVEKLDRKNIVYDSSTFTISYDSDDFNNYDYWNNVYDILIGENYNSSSNGLSVTGSFVYNNASYTISKVYASSVSNQYLEHNISFVTNLTISGGRPFNIVITCNQDLQRVDDNNGFSTYVTNGWSVTSETYYNLVYVAPSDDMPQVMFDFVSLLVGAISNVATGVAGGIGAMAGSLFLAYDGSGNVTGLSTFGGIIALFAGIALAIAITTRVYLWITSLGKN